MKRSLLLFLPLLLFFACSSKKIDEPVAQPQAVLKSVMDFLVYRQKHLHLSNDFKAVDSAGKVLSRSAFLQRLATGNYLPLKLKSAGSVSYYQAYPINPNTNKEISGILKEWGTHLYSLYQMEGKPLPGFNVADVQGKAYNDSTLKGRIAVVKFWFLHCVPCRKEIPALNALKEKYSARKDIDFVSLVFDSQPPVDSFLQTTRFDYAIVPGQKKYILEDLGITQFPTHLIINKQGLVSFVSNDEQSLAAALTKEAGQ